MSGVAAEDGRRRHGLEFPLLEPVRGIAACLVVAFHTATTFGVADGPGLLRQLVGRLEVTIWIFFVMSGFLIYRPFVRAHLADEPRPSTAGYAWRRFLRVAPGYWVALTVTTVWLDMPGVFGWPEAPRQYLLIKNYWEESYVAGLGPAWSLCVELQFYVLLPVYALVLRALPARSRRTSLEVAAAAVLIVASVWLKWDAMSRPGTLGARHVWWYFDALGAGMLLAVVQSQLARRPQPPRWAVAVGRAPGLWFAAAGLVYLYMSLWMGLNGDYRQPLDRNQIMERHLWYVVMAFLVVVPCVFGDPSQGVTRRVLGWRPFAFLGRISYGIYLYQVLVLVLMVRRGLGDVEVLGQQFLTWCVVVIGLTIVCATVSWYAIERPALRLKHWVSDRPRAPKRVDAPEPVAEVAAP